MSWNDCFRSNLRGVVLVFTTLACLHLQVAAEPASQASDTGSASGSEPDKRALWDAIWAKDMKTLDALLPTHTATETAKPWQVDLVRELAYRGQLEPLRLVQQKGYPFEPSVARTALDSMKPDVIRFSLQATKQSFESLCFNVVEPDSYGALIVEAMKWFSDSEWTSLLDFGVMRIPRQCATGADARDTRSQAEVVARYLMCDPLAATGAWATLLPKRVAEMRKYLVNYKPESPAFRQSLQSCLLPGKRYYEGDLLPEEPSMDSAFPAALKPLAKSLGLERLLFDDMKIPMPPANALWLAGRYEGRRKFGYSEEPQDLVLLRDGTFEWRGSSGLGSLRASGRWTVVESGAGKGTLILRSGNDTSARLRVVSTKNYPETSEKQRPISITVTSTASDRRGSIDVYAFSESEPLAARQVRLNEATEWEIDGTPKVFSVVLAGVSPQLYRLTTNARHALEASIPDARNLQSVVLELEVPRIDSFWIGYAKTFSYSNSDQTGFGNDEEIFVRRSLLR
ncbi:MAG: hypothetical protein J0H69_06500 [Burkholderiales bacterium]|nr:hypothetical protein [Burkholderiales bacterium]